MAGGSFVEEALALMVWFRFLGKLEYQQLMFPGAEQSPSSACRTVGLGRKQREQQLPGGSLLKKGFGPLKADG